MAVASELARRIRLGRPGDIVVSGCEGCMLRSMLIRVLSVAALGLLCLDTLSPALCFSDARQQGTALCRLLLHIQRRVAGESEGESD
jgi:hypothetical protein